MTPHGGYRPGSGRKPKPDKLVKVSAAVSQEVADYCRTVGNGEASAGIRLILTAAMQKALAKVKRKGE